VATAVTGKISVVSASSIGAPAGNSNPNVLRYAAQSNRTIARAVDLSGQTSAVLTFKYWRSAGFNGSNRSLTVEHFNGTSWVALASIPPPSPALETPDVGWTTYVATLPSPLAANAQIRFGDGVDLHWRSRHLPRRRVDPRER
jgi:hypothetical protein